MQTALLGAVTPDLRYVAVRWDERSIRARFVYDDMPSEDLVDVVAVCETEVLASVPEPATVSFVAESDRSSGPPRLRRGEALVYARRETGPAAEPEPASDSRLGSSEPADAEGPVDLTLTGDEALVLFEWVSRFNERESSDTIEDQAEQRVLWDVEALLESRLVAPLAPDYDERLAAARARVRDQD